MFRLHGQGQNAILGTDIVRPVSFDPFFFLGTTGPFWLLVDLVTTWSRYVLTRNCLKRNLTSLYLYT